MVLCLSRAPSGYLAVLPCSSAKAHRGHGLYLIGLQLHQADCTCCCWAVNSLHAKAVHSLSKLLGCSVCHTQVCCKLCT